MSKFTEDVFYEIPKEWFVFVNKLLEEIETYCSVNKITLPYILQIKEKYGTLRVYHSIGDDWSDNDLRTITMMIEITEKFCVR